MHGKAEESIAPSLQDFGREQVRMNSLELIKREMCLLDSNNIWLWFKAIPEWLKNIWSLVLGFETVYIDMPQIMKAKG